MQNRLERWSHLNMALIGGFIGGYAIVNHHDLLGSAQTGNMIALALYVGGMHTIDWLVRLLGMVIYMLGIAIAVLLPKKIESIKLKRFSILLDMASLLTVGFLPGKTDHFVALYPLFLASSVQLCSFPGADGFTCSSIFSTNNLRQCTSSFVEYFCSHDREALRKGKFYGKVLFCFHLGAALSYPTSQAMGLKSAWLGLIPCAVALGLNNKENHTNVRCSH